MRIFHISAVFISIITMCCSYMFDDTVIREVVCKIMVEGNCCMTNIGIRTL